jgi:phosphate transport system permease protein
MTNTRDAARARRIGEWVIEHALLLVGLVAVGAVVLVLLFMLRDALPLFFGDRVGVGEFLFGREWRPISQPPRFGIAALVTGSLLITAGASLIAIPLGMACAAFLAELAPRVVRETLKPVVELLAAIPSVVVGFIGLVVVSRWVRDGLELGSGLCAFTAAVMLALMALPTIITIGEDAISVVPRSYREGSLALGASRLATIRHAVLPAARSGLIAAAMLGVGRALGETMVVLMVAGNAIQMPLAFLGDPNLTFPRKLHDLVASGFGFFEPVSPLTSVLASQMGETATGSTYYHALFAIGAVLMLISFTITIISDLALRRVRRG